MYSHGLPVVHDDGLCARLRAEGFGVTDRTLGNWIAHLELDRNAAWPLCGCARPCKSCSAYRLAVSSQGEMAIQRIDPVTLVPVPPELPRLQLEAEAFACLHRYAESCFRRSDDQGLARYNMLSVQDGLIGL